ncbi:hypothetical protein P3T73_17380 [Kiritimatiellota bacterium B12222]|nr:hypothetical protein P3T73_17380 [Kiritimatiellota bacterium B12222]
MRFRFAGLIVWLLLMCTTFAESEAMIEAFVLESAPVEMEEKVAKPGWISKTLWYLPNRVFDFVDMFRLRLEVGPGIGVGARFTDDFSFYGGNSKNVYLGLPGPREKVMFPALMGLEEKRGVVLLGVDASDVLPHPPDYEYSEIGASVHLLVIGADVGFSTVELLDFFAGWIGKDYQHDDFPRTEPVVPVYRGSVLHPITKELPFPLDHRPDKFPGLRSRLDYLDKNVPIRVRSHLHLIDHGLAGYEDSDVMQPPVTGLFLGLKYQFLSGPNGSQKLDPKLKIKVDLPNFENRFSVFVQNSYDDDLPGTDEVDRNNKGWSVGLEKTMKKIDLYTDVGIHTKWYPEIFFRVGWRPSWSFGDWDYNFEQRFFWENEDKFGSLTQLQGYTWLGDQDRWVFRSLTAGRISETTKGMEWQQTLSFGSIPDLLKEDRRGENQSFNDALRCYGVNASVFFQDEDTTKYQATFVYRKALHGDFVVWEVEPGLEWRDENQWTTQYQITTGILFYF